VAERSRRKNRTDDEPADDKGLLWKTIKFVVDQLDTESVEDKIRRLKDERPEARPADLVGVLIREKALRSGLVGGLTALPANIPILGTIATLTIGTAVDLAAVLRYQCILVVEVGALFGKLGGNFQSMIDILTVLSVVSGDRRSRRDLERIKLSNVGDRCVNVGTRQLLNKVATRIGMKLVQKSSARTIPIVGALVGAGINYAAIDDVGRAAERYYDRKT